MKRIRQFSWIAAPIFLLAVWGIVSAAELTWTSTDAVRISDEEGETFNVADLADGETRTFGTGEKQITVTRNGDKVTISHAGRGEGKMVETTCSLDTDACKIITFSGDGPRIGLVIEKEIDCDGSDEDCDHALSTINLEGGEGRVMVLKSFDCEGSEDCGRTADILVHADHGDGDAFHVKQLAEGLGGFARAFVVGHDGVTLRCPEGDTTMHVDEEEADEVYLCPKHNITLEKATREKQVHKIMIREKKDD